MKRHVLKYICILISLACSFEAIAQTNQSLNAELSVARTNVYVNETIQITLTIRSVGLNIGQDISITGMPGVDQLLQIGEYSELAPTINIVNGVEMRTRQYVGDFRPLTTGPLSIKPQLQLALLTRRRSLFGTSVVHHSQHTLRVKPLHISVLPLPKTNIPEGFEGAVGNFSFNAEINPTEVQVGDLVNITTTVEGKGYLDDISPIGIPANSGFKIYDPKTIETKHYVRRFLQTVVVANTNSAVIPRMSFTYFDPETSKYVTKWSDPQRIKFHDKQETEIEKFQPEFPLSSKTEALTKNDSNEQSASKISDPSYWIDNKQMRTTINSDQPLYFAPSHTSLITMDIPANAQIEVLAWHGQWCKVQYNKNRGWIPVTAIKKP